MRANRDAALAKRPCGPDRPRPRPMMLLPASVTMADVIAQTLAEAIVGVSRMTPYRCLDAGKAVPINGGTQ